MTANNEITPLLVDRGTAQQMLGIRNDLLLKLAAAGEVERVVVGTTTVRYVYASLTAYIDRLREQAAQPEPVPQLRRPRGPRRPPGRGRTSVPVLQRTGRRAEEVTVSKGKGGVHSLGGAADTDARTAAALGVVDGRPPHQNRKRATGDSPLSRAS